MHDFCSNNFPHDLPLHLDCCEIALVLCLTPVPHFVLQPDHEDHDVILQSTLIYLVQVLCSVKAVCWQRLPLQLPCTWTERVRFCVPKVQINTAKKLKFFIKDSFSKCDQIRRKLSVECKSMFQAVLSLVRCV